MGRWLERVPLYPFLVGIYPVLYLLAVNIRETSPLSGMRTLLVFLGISILAFLAGLLLTRNGQKSGILSFFLILLFFLVFFVLYAPAYRALREVSLFGTTLGRHRFLVPISLLLLLLGSIIGTHLLKRIKTKWLSMFTLAGNLIGIILVLIPVATAGLYYVRRAGATANTQASLPPIEQPLQTDTALKPDIYYIILDTHTNDNIVRNILGEEWTEFSDELRQMGFFVSRCSQSNYSGTQRSLVSSLNMDYVQSFSRSTEISDLYPILMSNRVRRSVEEAGYQTHAFESGYKFTDLTDTDRFYEPVTGALDLLTYRGLTPFESLVMRISGGKILYEYREQLSAKMQYMIDAPFVEYRERILYTLDTLPSLVTEPGPKFVFAHILAPHDPFVFKENGDTITRRTPFTMVNDPEYRGGGYEAAYVAEMKYLDRRMLAIVKEIIAKSEVPPVIIIQGDHGLPRTAPNNAQFSILNAYYLGGDEDPHLYNTISPVNSFRVVFNHYFSTQYPLLPDDSYLYDKVNRKFELFEDGFDCR